MAFNTGNPLGSTDPRDLSDNSENLDRGLNGADLTWTDRLGNLRTSWRGATGYVGTGVNGAIEDYSAGIELTGYNVIIRYNGEFYRPSASATLPYTTTATLPDADSNLAPVGDANLRQDLLDSTAGSGASLVSMEGGPTVESAVNQRVIRVGSRAEMKTYDVPAGYQFGFDGHIWAVKSGTPASDPQEGVFVVLNNGNYAQRTGFDRLNTAMFGVTTGQDNAVQLQAAVDFAIANEYDVLLVSKGDGTYETTSPIVVDGPLWLIGEGSRRLGASSGAKIENTGTGDTITYSDTAAIYDRGVANLALTSTSGGSPLNLKYGAVRCWFKNLYLYTKSTGNACVVADYRGKVFQTDFVGLYTCIFEGGEYIVDNVARTVGIVDLLAEGTFINENQFRNLWITQASGQRAIRLNCLSATSVFTNNTFDNLTFEICSGGLINLIGTSHTSIKNVSAWDTPAGYDADLISVSGSTSFSQNKGLLIQNFAKVGNDPLNGSAVDINLGYSTGTTIVNHTPTNSAGAIVNFASRSAVVIGELRATAQNDGDVTYLNSSIVDALNVNARDSFSINGNPGVDTTFTTSDGKTVQVLKGLIISAV